MPKNCFHGGALVNNGDHAPGFLADGALQGVGAPDLDDYVAPLFRGEFGGRRRDAGGRRRGAAAPPVVVRWRWPRILLEYQPQ